MHASELWTACRWEDHGCSAGVPCAQAACKQPEALRALLERLQRSESAEVRLLAGQSLRKAAPKLWRRLSLQVCATAAVVAPACRILTVLALYGFCGQV